MAYQALYRKYRPNSFNDFIDQDNIKKILVNSIKNNKISHAYLFSGPRGIGKTSMAKIFAKAINCECFDKNDDACNKCDYCVAADNDSVDIVEIDAASNNGVDQIRELRNKISIVPSSLKYKVYIIDEVHMLTNSAFNALLKTLEEPPSYVVFILATTEFYEVPETIVSRCQCFNFGRISLNSLEERLKYISSKEKIKINDDTITEIAKYANGGLRDAISMLDKLRSFTTDEITVDVFKNINGMVSQKDIDDFYQAVFNKDITIILNIVNRINETGYDFKNFIERVMIMVRDNLVNYFVDKKEIIGDINWNVELVSVLNDILNRLKEAINPVIIVQVYILKFVCQNKTELNEADDKKNIAREIISSEILEKKDKQAKINVDISQKSELKESDVPSKSEIVINEKVKQIRINNAMATANKSYKKDLTGIWDKLDNYFMDDKYGKLSQLLSDTTPMVVGTEYLILIADSDGIMNNIYLNLSQAEDFLNKIYHLMKIVVISKSEFDNVKEKYILDKKNGIIYQVQEEHDKLVIENNNLINQALNLFGSDLVEIE